LIQDIAIYGAGGLGRELALMIQQINKHSQQWNIVGFFDDGLNRNDKVDSWVVLGGLADANGWSKKLSIVLAIADSHVRFKLAHQLVNPHLHFPILIHPSCNTGDEQRNLFGKGVILTANVVLTTNVKLEDFVIVNLATTIGHDVTIGTCSSIMPGCSISGNVKIGERTQVGTGARFLQNISVGNDSIVGAGAVVTKSFPSNSKLMGVPASNFAK
jgi:sugar O-acyltransferase (sialic acid O-acetyltransferase NeuD family)